MSNLALVADCYARAQRRRPAFCVSTHISNVRQFCSIELAALVSLQTRAGIGDYLQAIDPTSPMR